MTNMTRRHAMPYMALGGLLVLSVQMATGAFRVPAGPAQAASSHALPGHRLPAPIRFRLVPSGLASAFPHASGVVTINPGSLNDTVTVDVAHMPPNTTFTIFLTELRTQPFGNGAFVSELRTRNDGTGSVIFSCMALEAMVVDGRHPNTTTLDGKERVSGVQLEHLGLWFDDVKVAQRVLHDPKLKGTPFDGESPPLHAGPQAMVDNVTNGGAL
ncbi:MAG TPA: hypothetical protein VKF37_01495 [Chloroflexota bacterium]|nr:hypothetical protein [Chloroflexota bacterium]